MPSRHVSGPGEHTTTGGRSRADSEQRGLRVSAHAGQEADHTAAAGTRGHARGGTTYVRVYAVSAVSTG